MNFLKVYKIKNLQIFVKFKSLNFVNFRMFTHLNLWTFLILLKFKDSLVCFWTKFMSHDGVKLGNFSSYFILKNKNFFKNIKK